MRGPFSLLRKKVGSVAAKYSRETPCVLRATGLSSLASLYSILSVVMVGYQA